MHNKQKRGDKYVDNKRTAAEAEKVFATYMILPEKEKTLLLAYSTALRDRALLDEHTKQTSAESGTKQQTKVAEHSRQVETE